MIRRVLFIGSSTTYWNNMPTWVTKLSEDLGSLPRIEVTDRTVPNAGLHDHVESTGYWSALDAIRKGQWDTVILQGSPREPLDDPSQFFMDAAKLATEVRATGAEPLLFQSYAYDQGYYKYAEEPGWGGNNVEMQKRVSEAYTKAAQEIGARLARAGDAWQWVLNQNPEIKLYSNDHVHPSACGSYLMACIDVSLLTGKDPREASWVPTGTVTEDEAKVLRAVAWKFAADQDRSR
jgi:hypothetical protein